MKEYPTISGSKDIQNFFGQECIIFDKPDGSNLRVEWNKKNGWYKFGTRHRLFDINDKDFGPAIETFKKTLANDLKNILENYCKQATVFMEYLGPYSFAGQHDVVTLNSLGFQIEKNDPKKLILFDVCIHKKGFVNPEEFVSVFGHLSIAKVLWMGKLHAEIIDNIRTGKYPVKEGCVIKGGKGHKIWRRKVKTLEYLTELKKRFFNWEQFWE